MMFRRPPTNPVRVLLYPGRVVEVEEARARSLLALYPGAMRIPPRVKEPEVVDTPPVPDAPPDAAQVEAKEVPVPPENKMVAGPKASKDGK